MWKYFHPVKSYLTGVILIRCIKSIHTRANKLYNGFYYFYLVPPSTSWKDPMVKLERCDGIDLSNIIRLFYLSTPEKWKTTLSSGFQDNI